MLLYLQCQAEPIFLLCTGKRYAQRACSPTFYNRKVCFYDSFLAEKHLGNIIVSAATHSGLASISLISNFLIYLLHFIRQCSLTQQTYHTYLITKKIPNNVRNPQHISYFFITSQEQVCYADRFPFLLNHLPHFHQSAQIFTSSTIVSIASPAPTHIPTTPSSCVPGKGEREGEKRASQLRVLSPSQILTLLSVPPVKEIMPHA